MLPEPKTTPRDSVLLQRIAEGDSQALSELYDAHSQLLYTLILRIVRSTTDAQDVLQETLLLVWRRARQYDPALGSPAAWLVRIARNRAIDRWRANGRLESRHVSEAEGVSTSLAPDTLAARREEIGLISAALQQLPAEQRELIELAFFDGYTHAELAERCGLPLGTVKSRLRAGLGALRLLFRAPERFS